MAAVEGSLAFDKENVPPSVTKKRLSKGLGLRPLGKPDIRVGPEASAHFSRSSGVRFATGPARRVSRTDKEESREGEEAGAGHDGDNTLRGSETPSPTNGTGTHTLTSGLGGAATPG